MYENLITPYVFTPGPTKMSADILQLGAVQVPYFRNQAFSDIMLDCERMLLTLMNAPPGSRVVFLTASGTGAMEASVVNLLPPGCQAAVVNGGTFGQRFVEICRRHRVIVHEIQVDRDPLTDGKALGQAPPVAALLVNAHETSVGHCYDLQATASFCKRNDALHIVDAISLFVTDPIDMDLAGIDVMIVSSHKGLALPPGLSMVALSPKAINNLCPSPCYYFDFASHLADGERGQTPFTPAISILLQLHHRLSVLLEDGLAREWRRIQDNAAFFRNHITHLPLRPYASNMPNAMTALEVTDGSSALSVVNRLQENYHYFVAPNGGILKNLVFRVSHMGAIEVSDMQLLISALTNILGGRR